MKEYLIKEAMIQDITKVIVAAKHESFSFQQINILLQQIGGLKEHVAVKENKISKKTD